MPAAEPRAVIKCIFWILFRSALSRRGHHLFGRPNNPLASAEVGDARHLPHGDATADAVLLLAPLYHLVEREDRLACLREIQRVLRPGG